MKQLPILFARGNNGKVLTYRVEVEDNKFRMITGAKGFKLVTSKWTVVKEGKNIGKSNETTPEEQAYSQAFSKWEKKLKSGGYFESEEDIDNELKFIEPMLANPYDERIGKVTFPVMVDRKYNGMRQTFSSKGQLTRKGEKILSAPHIAERLSSLLKKFPNLFIDGELYNHDYRFKLNEIIKLVRKTKLSSITKEDFENSEKLVDLYVYDGYGFSIDGEEITKDTVCSERRNALTKLLEGISDVIVVDFKWAKNDEQINEYYQEYVADGYEGAIIREDSAYEHKRTNALLKYKPEDDAEVLILDIKDGSGNWAGSAYKVTIRMDDGKEFDGVFTGPWELRKEILKNKKDWIGKTVTGTYMKCTGLGTPNSFRIDPENCFKGDR